MKVSANFGLGFSIGNKPNCGFFTLNSEIIKLVPDINQNSGLGLTLKVSRSRNQLVKS